MPRQLSAPEGEALLLPPLSMPQRGPTGHLGADRVCHCILWGLYPERQGQGLPIPPDSHGTPAMHATTVSKVLATWADAGSLWPACVARGRHRAGETQLALRGRHGDGTNTGAHKGARAGASRGTTTQRARRSWLSSTRLATSSRRSPWLPPMRPPWGCDRRAYKRCQRARQRSGGTAEGPRAISLAALRRRTRGRAASLPAGCPTSPRSLAQPSAAQARAQAALPHRDSCVAEARRTHFGLGRQVPTTAAALGTYPASA
jgi:hypothetical protein